MRAALLLVIVAAAVAAFWFRPAPTVAPVAESPRHTYVTTAHQLGVVGYRDPAGALSPDGMRVAYSEGRNVRVVPVGGGAPRTLPAGEGQVRSVMWAGNQRLVIEDTAASDRWWISEISTEGATRRPLWSDRPAITSAAGSAAPATIHANDLRQLTWSADGRWAAGMVNAKDGPELWRVSADRKSVV